MIRSSEMLRSLVAAKSPDDLKLWVLLRFSGEDSMPMIFQGKEVERPHEAVAVLFGLSGEVLPPEKRAAVITALKEIRSSVSEAWVEGNPTPQQIEQARRWGEVVELAKPEELRNDARLFLEACMLGPDSAALPALAAAAAAFPESNNYGPLLWNKLLERPETAALAFRRLLVIEPFHRVAQHWVTLLRKRVKEHWPANVRLLAGAMLSKAPADSNLTALLANMIDQVGLLREAMAELNSSKDAKVGELRLAIVHKYAKRAVSFLYGRKRPGRTTKKGQNLWSDKIEKQRMDVSPFMVPLDRKSSLPQPALEDDAYASLANVTIRGLINEDDRLHGGLPYSQIGVYHPRTQKSEGMLRTTDGYEISIQVDHHKTYQNGGHEFPGIYVVPSQRQSRMIRNSQHQLLENNDRVMIANESSQECSLL